MRQQPLRILVLCTGNSARSQMAEALLKKFDPTLEVHSAGTRPSDRVHPAAVLVMREIGLDISANRPKNINLFLSQPFDFVITVCDDAQGACPAFTGRVGRHVHMGFDDPAKAAGTEAEVLGVFRRVRDQLSTHLRTLFEREIAPLLVQAGNLSRGQRT